MVVPIEKIAIILMGVLLLLTLLFFIEIYFLSNFKKFYYDFNFPSYKKVFVLPIQEKESAQHILHQLFSDENIEMEDAPLGESFMCYYLRKPISKYLIRGMVVFPSDRIKIVYEETADNIFIKIYIMPFISLFFIFNILMLIGVLGFIDKVIALDEIIIMTVLFGLCLVYYIMSFILSYDVGSYIKREMALRHIKNVLE